MPWSAKNAVIAGVIAVRLASPAAVLGLRAGCAGCDAAPEPPPPTTPNCQSIPMTTGETSRLMRRCRRTAGHAAGVDRRGPALERKSPAQAGLSQLPEPMAEKQYRALLSVPIFANTDDEAVDIAMLYAEQLRRGSNTIAGHCELVAATRRLA